MSYVQVSDDTCIKVVSKAGSQSMNEAFNSIVSEEISVEEALALDNRVMFLRNPVTRVNSVFNHVYGSNLYHSDFSQHIDSDIIKSHGARYAGAFYHNEHHYSVEKQRDYNEAVARHEEIGGTREEIVRRMNNEDYRRFIDLVLSGNKDQHWAPQVSQAIHNGRLVCNIVRKFEDVGERWRDHVPGGKLPHINSWGSVERSDYLTTALREYYAEDLQLWSSL